jgi:hypothetical protein
MATLTTQNIATTGILPTYAAAAGGGDAMVADSTSFLHIKNGTGSSMVVTLVTPATVDTNLAVTDRAVTVGANSEQMISVPAELYRDPTTGLAAITYSLATSVTVAAIRR